VGFGGLQRAKAVEVVIYVARTNDCKSIDKWHLVFHIPHVDASAEHGAVATKESRFSQTAARGMSALVDAAEAVGERTVQPSQRGPAKGSSATGLASHQSSCKKDICAGHYVCRSRGRCLMAYRYRHVTTTQW
jgi:hypothetical protein